MVEPAIHVDHLAKRYWLGSGVSQYGRLSESLAGLVKIRGRRAPRKRDEFWALRDVSFEVQTGDAVAVIGHNGAGKSTLLKILSRVTEPSGGSVRLRGRVGSLLEVGTGFHPELTGRENIFLNGAILGMKRAETRRRFDEIVDFAEVERFLDTPVKRYSSGMYVRLAFAVAAHLEPDILIIDEVLAVGDAAFQKKCLGKMEDVSTGGRTVLFVSHNMATVSQLCSSAVWLSKGEVMDVGPTGEVVARYLSSTASFEGEITFDRVAAPGVDFFGLEAVRVRNWQGQIASTLDSTRPFTMEVDFVLTKRLPYCRVGIVLSTSAGTVVFESYDSDNLAYQGERMPGCMTARCEVPGNLLNAGRYVVGVVAGVPNVVNMVDAPQVLAFDIEDVSTSNIANVVRNGVIRPLFTWSVTARS